MKNLKFKLKILNQENGYVISIITIFVLIIMLSVALSMSSLIFYRQKISTNSVESTQAYYASEAGIEDALMLLRDDPQILVQILILEIDPLVLQQENNLHLEQPLLAQRGHRLRASLYYKN